MKKELIILIIALFFITPSASYAYSLSIHKKSWKSTKTRAPINEPPVLLDNDGQILLYSEYGIYNIDLIIYNKDNVPIYNEHYNYLDANKSLPILLDFSAIGECYIFILQDDNYIIYNVDL